MPPNPTPTTDWHELTKLTQGQPILIERVRIPGKDFVIEGQFELPQLARLSQEDQVFITAFVRSHGSIKEMEKVFGVSYPTIKSRLNRIAESLEFIETNPGSIEERRNHRRGRDPRTGGFEMIPYSAEIQVRTERNRSAQRWIIPFWLAGLLLLPLCVLLLPLVFLVCAIARINPFPLLGAFWKIFVALKGTIVDVDDPHYSVSVQIS